MQRGDIRYARAGEHHIAYREYLGEDGDLEIVMVNGQNFPMESLPDDPIGARLIEGLARLGRLVLFDRRGIALSDPITDWDTPMFGQWADDLAAVIRDVGYERPAVVSWCDRPVARACAVRHPDLIGSLVLFNPTSPTNASDAQWIRKWWEHMKRVRAGEHLDDPGRLGRGDEPSFRAWMDEAGRLGASPRQAERLARTHLTDPPLDNALVTAPTLVITRSPADGVIPAEYVRRAATQIAGAKLADLGVGDGLIIGDGVDDVLAEISRFLTGQVVLPAPDRRLAAVLFTDLVDSTRLAAESGDAAWKQVLDRHDEVTRAEVGRNGGEVVKMTGDGVLALLPSATGAVDAARGLRERLVGDDLGVRIGIHVGEVDRRGDDVSGLAINIAARVMTHADEGQILTSAIVTELADSVAFTPLGSHRLKGIEGEWPLYVVDGRGTEPGSATTNDD